MDADSDRCALELSDARVDVLRYACLVAIMSMGRSYHRQPVLDRLGLPVLSAAVCTTYQMLRTLGLKAAVPDAGELLSGRY